MHTKIPKLKPHFHCFLGVMKYAIETHIFFEEATTFPNTENQTPNKETNQITPLLCAHPPASQFICPILNSFYAKSSLSFPNILV